MLDNCLSYQLGLRNVNRHGKCASFNYDVINYSHTKHTRHSQVGYDVITVDLGAAALC